MSEGLIPRLDGMILEQKLKKATVALFACKKLREIILTKLTLENFHLEDTTNLHILPLLAYQEELLLYGMAVFFQDLLSAKIHTKSL